MIASVDRGKPGSKILAIGERGGPPLHVEISAANLNDHRMLQDMVDGVRPVRQPIGRPRKRPAKLHADKGYDFPAAANCCVPATSSSGSPARASSPRNASAGTATSSNAAWNG
ncbi:transposase [Actinoplanes sp. NBC_00393]|uniref:transposase n=1 Tax=Actinoplanes sp. NBC_00393 TaxID=2975953 RepID=UPI002E239452